MNHCYRLVVFLLLGLCLVLGLSGDPALAHAALRHTQPADQEVLVNSPPEVVLHFNETVEVTQLRVLNAAGETVVQGSPVVAGEQATVSLQTDLPRGLYTVSWRAISADGHPVRGGFVFSVGVAQAGDIPHPDAWDPWRWGGAGGRALLYGGSLLSVGIAGWSRRGLLWCIGVTMAASGAGLLTQFMQLYGEGSGTGWGSLFTSAYGISAGVRMLGMLGLLAVPTRGWGQGLVLLSFCGVGHSARQGIPAMGILFLHLAGIAFWGGGLLRIALGKADRQAIQHFSRRATLIVPLLTLAGLGLGLIHLGWPWQIRNLYTQLVLFKLLIVLLLLGLAAHNKFRLLPTLAQGSLLVLPRLRRMVTVEILGLALLLLVTTALVEQDPSGFAQTHPPEQNQCQLTATDSTGQAITLCIIPCRAGENTLILKTQTDRDPLTATLVFSLPEQDIDPIRRPMQQSPKNSFFWHGGEMAQSGLWQIEVELLLNEFQKNRYLLETFLP
ncbi:MAG: copper resistance protein CopC [Cyanobacteriota bacterium]|nr:copper resistance protein CopC [Cyanobacteriota bacterium]